MSMRSTYFRFDGPLPSMFLWECFMGTCRGSAGVINLDLPISTSSPPVSFPHLSPSPLPFPFPFSVPPVFTSPACWIMECFFLLTLTISEILISESIVVIEPFFCDCPSFALTLAFPCTAALVFTRSILIPSAFPSLAFQVRHDNTGSLMDAPLTLLFWAFDATALLPNNFFFDVTTVSWRLGSSLPKST